MSGRFPGASTLDAYWRNLLAGKESITHFTAEELAAYVPPETCRQSNYVKAKGCLEGIEYFDAAFFGYNQKEASQLSPQLRIFQECVWEAIEDAGYNVQAYPGSIGVYAGASSSLLWQLLTNFDGSGNMDQFNAALLNDKDYLSTRTSYQLNLKGPSITINTACSTSLVAVHMACRALLTRDCDMALAGGVSVSLPTRSGYLHEDGMITSADGHCKPFDRHANGTVFSDGGGVVLLKTLKQALQDNDPIHAVILGSAINNDGRSKVGFTAPSTTGQAEVLRQAYKSAKVPPESIGYVETHGTATQIGDPIEIEALKSVFGGNPSLLLGSVKSNLGHLDVAAGVASLIKAILALKHRVIPPTLHFRALNDKIVQDDTRFSINTAPVAWDGAHPVRRCGVNSFGIGGTNAHVILEEAPARQCQPAAAAPGLLLVSARTENALAASLRQLSAYVADSGVSLTDLAFTQNFGRVHFDKRVAIPFAGREELREKLETILQKEAFAHSQRKQKVIFAFGGIGPEYPGMGAELLGGVALFREALDGLAQEVRRLDPGLDIVAGLYAGSPDHGTPFEENKEVLLFCFQYALATLLVRVGVEPSLMIGHGVGQYVAAAVSGVLSVPDALRILLARKRINRRAAVPSLLSIHAGLAEVAAHLGDGVTLAACNAATSTVVAGPEAALGALKEKLARLAVRSAVIPNTQVFNTGLPPADLAELAGVTDGVRPSRPRIPYHCCITGEKVTAETVAGRDHWSDLASKPIRFDLALNEAMQYEGATFVEIGPSVVISAWVNRHPRRLAGQSTLNVVRNRHERTSDVARLNEVLGELWKRGVPVALDRLEHLRKGNRTWIPVYPFDRKYIWIPTEQLQLHRAAKGPEAAKAPVGAALSRTEIARQLQEIWGQVLGDEAIHPEKNLFEMGVTSLDAVNANRILKDRLNVHVEVTTLFEYPTIASCANYVFERSQN